MSSMLLVTTGATIPLLTRWMSYTKREKQKGELSVFKVAKKLPHFVLFTTKTLVQHSRTELDFIYS